MEDPIERSAGSQSTGPQAISGDALAVDTRVDDPAPLDPNRRVYQTSRCVFRGGYVAPEYLDPPFLDVAQRAAPVVTQIPDTTADDFLYDLLAHSPYRDPNGLRIESPHMAAAEFCEELIRYMDNYPRFRSFTASERAELKAELEGFAAEYRAIADRDLNGKAEETARLNEAYRSGLPLWKGKHGFAVEFAGGAFVSLQTLSGMGGIPSPSAMGLPTLHTDETARKQILDLQQSFPHLRYLNRRSPAKRNHRYSVIDDALKQIAQSRPSSQIEIFRALHSRHVVTPPGGPFRSAGGWIRGFQQCEPAARAWLSRRWDVLNLPPLPRGPKK